MADMGGLSRDVEGPIHHGPLPQQNFAICIGQHVAVLSYDVWKGSIM